jgi:hypothetical protein
MERQPAGMYVDRQLIIQEDRRANIHTQILYTKEERGKKCKEHTKKGTKTDTCI